MDQPDQTTPPPKGPWYNWRRWGLNFLTVSIVVHLLFLIGAAYFVVQTFSKRKQTFTAAAKGPNASTRALEQKVQMKRNKSMGAPMAVKRVTTTSNMKVSLPAMPAMPAMDAPVIPISMAGMGTMGTGVGMGMGSGGGGGGGGGGGLSLFGLHGGAGLEGHFVDLKQTSGGRPVPMTAVLYNQELANFVKGGFNDGILAKYFRAPSPLYASQIFIPTLDAEEGPRAFNVASTIKANFTAVHYKGKVAAQDSGRYRFVGYGDNILVVRFNGRVVLDCGSSCPSGVKPAMYYTFDGETVVGSPGSGPWYRGSGVGSWVDVEGGATDDMEVLIGEEGGDLSAYFLQIQKDGDTYQNDSKGNPILPIFKLNSAETKLPPPGSGHIGEAPVFAKSGPVWRTAAASSSIFSH